MKEYLITKVNINHPELGIINIIVDESEGQFEGWWRQSKPFNSRFPAVGKWTPGRISAPELMLFDELKRGPALIKLSGFVNQSGRRGKGNRISPKYDYNVTWNIIFTRKITELTIQDIARNIKDTKWRITGSKGISYGIGEGITVEGNIGSIFLKGDSEAQGVKHELVYSTAGAGMGLSTLPVVITGSTESMPSGGIGRIFTRKQELSLLDFEGYCFIGEVNGSLGLPTKATAQGGGGLYAVIFGSNNVDSITSPHSIGFMWGTFGGGAQNPNNANKNFGGAITAGTTVVMR